MASREDIRRYLANRQGEIDAIHLYGAMAKAEASPHLAEIYRRLAEVEDRHARLWEEELRKAGAPVPPRTPTLRARLKIALSRLIGPEYVLPMVAAGERADRTMYDNQPEANRTDLPRDERSHARILGLMAQTGQPGMAGSALARLEGRHRTLGGNALRAAVLGANDGLLSNMSLIMGVSGAELSGKAVLVTGMAGLLAGAFSMAIGEWVSVQSSREANQNQIDIEAAELLAAPEDEEAELALIYQAKGVPEDRAKEMAKHLISDKDKALDTLVREELGIDPAELGGSAWEAALASFFLFALGALVPLAPFFFLDGALAAQTSLAASAIGIFGIGAAITLVTGRSPWLTGARQLLLALAAAGVTYGIGHFLGVHLGG
jgi:vacuolar iron transporter family protein